MKKILIIFICLIALPLCVSAKKIKVELEKCIDGDTISIKKDEIITKVRFLAIDAPEIDKDEPYSVEAKDYLCNLIKSGKNLYIEYDNKADKTDKYDRTLAWVWIDNTFLQGELVKNGYAKVAYLYDEYKYASELKEFEKYAKDEKLNIWSNYVPKQKTKKVKKSKKDEILDKINKYYDIIAITLALILALITFNITSKKKNKSHK
ncbi:MAG: thermonuclease family protein [Bacilli bacterium]|nr:thermonuclease family protein [Bacilli bacterium]